MQVIWIYKTITPIAAPFQY
uniref:Uncharacterized protein n=1 Tax=Rhizophora mucronata TaxID=61149 RepID=A0A2P2NTL9_RHIMU